MKKLYFILLIPLVLTSCTVLYPQSKQAIPRDQQNFSLAFDEFQKNHRLDSLQKLKMDFPHSLWSSRAETIILYAQELDQRKAQNNELRESERVQAFELEQLKKLNQQLTEQIEQLKSLLIELEKRPK